MPLKPICCYILLFTSESDPEWQKLEKGGEEKQERDFIRAAAAERREEQLGFFCGNTGSCRKVQKMLGTRLSQKYSPLR